MNSLNIESSAMTLANFKLPNSINRIAIVANNTGTSNLFITFLIVNVLFFIIYNLI